MDDALDSSDFGTTPQIVHRTGSLPPKGPESFQSDIQVDVPPEFKTIGDRLRRAVYFRAHLPHPMLLYASAKRRL